MRVSVIIPTLNEREHLPQTIAALQNCDENFATLHEIIIADGGSTDGTREWLDRQNGIRLFPCERGRGTQLHFGALQAAGDVLFFLHADCLPDPQSLDAIAHALQNERISGGCFRIGFSTREASYSLRFLARAINFRSRVARTATGDQGIFARRAAYEKLGGFKSWPLFEDIDFATRLKSQGQFVVLRPTILISARRWNAHGVGRTTLLMALLLLGYHLKISPARLKRWFSDMTPSIPKYDEK